jgi:hypothetical protein
MILHDAYHVLKRLGLVANHAAFATGYLNKRPRYYDDLVCSQRPPSVAALLSLYVRVRAIADAFAGRPPIATHAEELNGIARRTWLELERRCCSLLPDRKHRPCTVRAATRPRDATASGPTTTTHRYSADGSDAHADQPALRV